MTRKSRTSSTQIFLFVVHSQIQSVSVYASVVRPCLSDTRIWEFPFTFILILSQIYANVTPLTEGPLQCICTVRQFRDVNLSMALSTNMQFSPFSVVRTKSEARRLILYFEGTGDTFQGIPSVIKIRRKTNMSYCTENVSRSVINVGRASITKPRR